MTDETGCSAREALIASGLDFSGQRVVIVGAGGIGAECARLYAALGAELTVFDRVIAPDLIQSINHGHQHSFVAADIAVPKDLDSIVLNSVEADALVVTSAICPDESMLAAESDEWMQCFDQTFHINLAAPIRLCQRVLPAMQARGSGRIVLTGSLAGRNGGLLSGAQYAASKGALHTFVKWLALRAAPHGVNVNGVAPGVTETAMITGRSFDAGRIPAGRPAQPVEVARAIMFLSSCAASYIHGQVLDVNGGAWLG